MGRLPARPNDLQTNQEMLHWSFGQVLPDDSTGQGPGTLGRKWFRCKEGMARPPERRQPGRCFCRHGIRFIACRRDRGTIYISGRVIVPVTNVRNRQWGSVAV